MKYNIKDILPKADACLYIIDRINVAIILHTGLWLPGWHDQYETEELDNEFFKELNLNLQKQNG